ncbi:MAG: helix-turn-helix transcriptional regulator [Ilumatobacteraceae bacterium]
MGGEELTGVNNADFGERFGALLRAARRRTGRSCRTLGKFSGGRFAVSQLHQFERGEIALDPPTVEFLSQLYGADLEALLPDRPTVFIGDGMLSVGTLSCDFPADDSAAMLQAYLKLVRTLRRQQGAPCVELRRDDVECLADHLSKPGETVIDMLGGLMGSTRSQRPSMVSLFASGAVVVGVVSLLAGS